MRARSFLFAVLLVPSLAASQEPSAPPSIERKGPQHAKQPQGRSDTDQRGTESLPLVAKLTSSNSSSPSTQPQPASHNEQPSPDWWMVIPTWLLAVFTFGLFIYTARLWKATGQLVQESRSSLQSTQRAFVFIKTLEVHNFLSPKRLVIIPQWENSGDTPTKNMLNHVNWMLLDTEMPTDFDFPDLAGEERTPTLIGPHSTQYASALEIDAQHIDAVIDGKARIYIWGWAEYDDVFAGTNRHRTEFCNEVVISRISEQEIAVRFRLYKIHNGADSECLKKVSSYA